MKKIIILLLVSAALVGLMSCSGGEKEAFEVDFTSEVTDEDLDLDGFKFRILLDGTEADDQFLRYYNTTVMADAARARVDDLNEKYNCNISTFYGDINNLVLSAVGGYEANFEVVQRTGWNTENVGLVRAGYYFPVNEIETLDYTDTAKWGTRSQLEVFCWDNNLYGVIPVAWPEYSLNMGDYLFVVNSDIVTSLGQPDPREYVENETWTREKLSEVTKAYTSTENTDKIYGLTVNPPHLGHCVVMTCSEGIVGEKNGDYYIAGLFSNEAYDSLMWLQDYLFTDCRDNILKKSVTLDVCRSFIGGNATMMLMHSSYIFRTVDDVSVLYSGIPFAILPFPNPNGSSDKFFSTYDHGVYGLNIPVSVADPELTGFVLDKLYSPLEGFETQDAIIDYYNTNIFFDERDAEVFRKVIMNPNYSYFAEGLGDVTTKFTKTAVDVRATLDSSVNIVNDIIDEYIRNIKDSAATLWADNEE